MRIAIRSDSGTQVGGGHVMRCLSLAIAARDAGHEVQFVCAEVDGHLGDRIAKSGFEVSWLSAKDLPASGEDIESWRPMPVAQDAEQTIAVLQDVSPDWIILDHYGLGGAWVKALRAALPDLKILALDDLDREPLFADFLLNPAAFPDTPISQPHMAMLKGPAHALLRPEFRTLRPNALKRRTGEVKSVLILPGMVDNLGFAAAALTAMRDLPGLKAEVVMGSQSPSVPQIKALVADVPNWSLTLDATDMAEHLHSADLAIGAGGVSAWERCCLGLPAVNVALAENQQPGV
ncbi:MAG: UDP-2,4-diacetamido-2,4,6-trideoxy-beta-L-altropyranose hydrolase, partial [Dinoroseobacter sp.]|nr:UDP-2,4-diacetamido-2,4,6-trideoxy-beta-L-altropyranose hydrolase [Dinoroseobacter sp.]